LTIDFKYKTCNYVLYNYNFSSVVYCLETVILDCNYVQDIHQLNRMSVCKGTF